MRRIVLASLALLSLALLGCGLLGGGELPPATEPAGAWSPAPVTALVEAATPTNAIEPTREVPGTSPAPTASRAPAADEPDEVVITEGDITQALASGIAAQEGLDAEGLEVRFSGGKTYITADRLAYGPLQVRSLAMVGRLVARDGALQYETESVSPSGLVTAMVPELANQALRQYGRDWHIEQVRTEDGQVVLLVS